MANTQSISKLKQFGVLRQTYINIERALLIERIDQIQSIADIKIFICNSCNSSHALFFCLECNEFFCHQCFEEYHAALERAEKILKSDHRPELLSEGANQGNLSSSH